MEVGGEAAADAGGDPAVAQQRAAQHGEVPAGAHDPAAGFAAGRQRRRVQGEQPLDQQAGRPELVLVEPVGGQVQPLRVGGHDDQLTDRPADVHWITGNRLQPGEVGEHPGGRVIDDLPHEQSLDGIRQADKLPGVNRLSLAVISVAVAAFLAPVAAADPVSRDCPGPNQYYADPDDATLFWECSNGIAYRFDCPAGLFWDTTLLTCNYPEQVPVNVSTTTAGTARLSLDPLGLTDLNARFDAGPSVGRWATITFTAADGTVLCTAQADNSGYASCDAEPGALETVADLLAGYTATYAGKGSVTPSSGHGSVRPR
ncbi:hypothetical protein D5S17_26650 [Pseudonocardiaceae bacterium YIM PH 21723]|nr:hypothetical protein D5S17_26650 [Pseudonocardiaceae bacterium YIM PH 21723]